MQATTIMDKRWVHLVLLLVLLLVCVFRRWKTQRARTARFNGNDHTEADLDETQGLTDVAHEEMLQAAGNTTNALRSRFSDIRLRFNNRDHNRDNRDHRTAVDGALACLISKLQSAGYEVDFDEATNILYRFGYDVDTAYNYIVNISHDDDSDDNKEDKKPAATSTMTNQSNQSFSTQVLQQNRDTGGGKDATVDTAPEITPS